MDLVCSNVDKDFVILETIVVLFTFFGVFTRTEGVPFASFGAFCVFSAFAFDFGVFAVGDATDAGILPSAMSFCSCSYAATASSPSF